MQEKILVVIPTYNCEKQIQRVLLKCIDVLPYLHTIVVINNRSTDDTEACAVNGLKHLNDVHTLVFRNHQNYGYGGSLKIGFEFAVRQSFDWVIVINGDDQSSILDFLPQLTSGNYKNHEVLWGCRFLKNSSLRNYSKPRFFANHVFNSLFRFAIQNSVHDIGCGVYMYSTKLLKKRFYLGMPEVLYIGSFLRLTHDYYQHNLIEFPIHWSSDDESSSVKVISQTLAHFKLAWTYFFNKEKFISTIASRPTKDFTTEIIYSNIPYSLTEFRIKEK